MTGLAHARAVSDLVPGDADRLERLAGRLFVLASGVGDSGHRVAGLPLADWHGPAAEAYRAALGPLPAFMGRAGEAFAVAALTLRDVASSMRDAQAAAQHALQLWQEAEHRTAQWQLAVAAADAQPGGTGYAGFGRAAQARLASGVPAHDPGAPDRLRAERMLQAAREQADAVAARAAARLREVTSWAPRPAPRRDHLHEFVAGVGESLAGLASLAWRSSPVRMSAEPLGFLQDLWRQAEHGLDTVRDPVRAGKAALDWDTWQDNPARALGHLGPDAVLAAVTGGTGAAARSLAGREAGLTSVRGAVTATTARPPVMPELRAGARINAPGGEDAPGWLSLNGGVPLNRIENCVQCTATGEWLMRGGDAQALPALSGGTSVTVLEQHFSATFERMSSAQAVADHVRGLPDGARGIVYAAPLRLGPDGLELDLGHVFNVVNRNGTPVFLDFQTGTFTHVQPGWTYWEFMRTW